MQLSPSLSSDHKNLANLQTAKTLNAGQARWALFFTCFQFSISYRHGSHNVKPDALSRQYSGSEDKTDLVPILPATCTVAVIPWEAQKTEPNTGGGPARRLFVPHTIRSQFLHWAHIARFTCHPRVHRTIRFLQRYFRWPSLTRDAQEYVSACITTACPVCTWNKPSSQPPAGQLHPLSTPSRPWSHIALDFVTGCYATV